MEKIWTGWNRFWFSQVSLLNLAVLRIALGLTLAGMYFLRQSDVNFLFTEAGFLPKASALDVLPEAYRPPFLLSVWQDSWSYGMHGLLVVLLMMLVLGVGTRVVALAAAYLDLAFLFRNYGGSFGADQIGAIFLLYLSLTQSDARLSIRSWWRKRRGLAPLQGDLVTSVFYRMIQIQLCVIYAYSGMEKLRGSAWWDGTAVWSVLANSQMVILDLTWIRHFPFVPVVMSFMTLVFEIYFPALVWNHVTRRFVLIFGVFFHAGIGILMALWSFALVMIAPYVLFLPEEMTSSILRRFRLQGRPVSR